jgi:hypothetical protein
MRIHLFSSDQPCQKIIDNAECGPVNYLYFKNSCLSTSAQLDKRNFNLMDSHRLSESESEDILNDYINIIGSMSIINGTHREWWSTDIASKNRILSPMQGALNQLILSIRVIDNHEHDRLNLYIFGVSYPVITVIKKYCEQKKIIVEVDRIFFLRLSSRFSLKLKSWNIFLRDMLSSLLRVARSRISYGKVKVIKKGEPVFLIKSWVFPSSFSSNNSYQDPYCGNLASYLTNYLENKTKVVTISQGFNERDYCYKKMKDINGRIIIPVESFLSYSDVFFGILSTIWYQVTYSIKIPNSAFVTKIDLRPMLYELVKSTGRLIRFGDYLYYYLGRRLAKNFALKGCVMSYEGNHWEKMFILGLRDINSEIKIIGYHHSAIPQAAAGVFLSECEVGLTPSPNRIVTTGLRSCNILKRYSHFPHNKIQPGCALAHQYLYDFDFLPRRKHSDFRVLVALEGVLEACELLSYVIHQSKQLPLIEFTVRSHPALPIEVLLRELSIDYKSLPANIKFSNVIKVVDDISRCNVLLYWGTATSVEALMMGVPLICFNRGDTLSFDPLFNFSEFKWSVDTNTPILPILDEIKNMPDQHYTEKSFAGNKYVKEYLTKASKENIRLFLAE